ncbi:hypothetical protein HAX54_034372 [Datura stramonium]|uniref:Uncharacterized protein n=1 Tax=Datura stramonium TaxID=4076 RepID=A0ABS8SE43_DATST|nr:hypothetical protein [Datura stramonium]
MIHFHLMLIFLLVSALVPFQLLSVPHQEEQIVHDVLSCHVYQPNNHRSGNTLDTGEYGINHKHHITYIEGCKEEKKSGKEYLKETLDRFTVTMDRYCLAGILFGFSFSSG